MMENTEEDVETELLVGNVERLLIACLFGFFLSESCHTIHGQGCEEKYPPTFVVYM